MKKLLVLLVSIVVVLYSCCEKDVYLAPDPSDEVIGVYRCKGSYYNIYDYKIKVVRISSDSIFITPYIGNEMRPYYAVFLEKEEEKMIFRACANEFVYFYTSEIPPRIFSEVLPVYEGEKIE